MRINDVIRLFVLKVLWPVLKKLIAEAFKDFCLWVSKKIRDRASNYFDERAAQAGAKAKEAEQKAANASTEQEAEVYSAEAKTWRSAEKMFVEDKEDMSKELEDFQLDALRKANDCADQIPKNKALEKYIALGSTVVTKADLPSNGEKLT